MPSVQQKLSHRHGAIPRKPRMARMKVASRRPSVTQSQMVAKLANSLNGHRHGPKNQLAALAPPRVSIHSFCIEGKQG